MGAKLNRCIWRDCGFKYNNYSDKELKNLEAYLKEVIFTNKIRNKNYAVFLLKIFSFSSFLIFFK